MKLPANTFEYAKVGDRTLVLYNWGSLSETSCPKIWQNVEFFDENGKKLWTVNGMEDCPCWENDSDTFVGIEKDGANWQLISFSGCCFSLDLKTGYVTYLSFHK